MEIDFEDLFDEVGTDLPVDIPDDLDLLEGEGSTFGSVDPSNAENQIQEISDYQDSLSSGSEDGEGSDFGDFFLKEPYLGLILLAVIIIVVVAVVFMVARRK